MRKAIFPTRPRIVELKMLKCLQRKNEIKISTISVSVVASDGLYIVRLNWGVHAISVTLTLMKWSASKIAVNKNEEIPATDFLHEKAQICEPHS